MQDETRLAHAGLIPDEQYGAVSAPIYQTATFRHPEVGKSTGFDYTRSENPTRQVLETEMAALEEAAGAFAFSTGMAALTTVCLMFQAGDEVLVSDDLYGGTWRLLEDVLAPLGLKARYVDMGDLGAVRKALSPATRGLLVETPTNPLMKIADLQALGTLAREKNLLYIVDNTFLTPWLQKPHRFGADIVVHSGTKYLSGHNDTLCGLATARTPELAARLKFLQNATGGVLSPWESWLVLRGLKTLALRMDRAQANALALARFLKAHPAVTAVYYTGLEGHPGREVHQTQARGDGAMVSFRVKTPDQAVKIINSVKVISFAESLGGVESLITWPAVQTHAAIPEETRKALGVTGDLLRLSVGIEALEDLRADLAQALEAAK